MSVKFSPNALKQLFYIAEKEKRLLKGFKKIIEDTAAKLLFLTSGVSTSGNRTYYFDKQILLQNYWSTPENFHNFIREIDRNLLFVDDLTFVCKKINKKYDCDYHNCKESGCALQPFSMLYQIGLLGMITLSPNTKSSITQHFIESKEITYYRNESMIFPSDETIFALHPALTKCIEKSVRMASIMHFNKFILGKGLSIPRDKVISLLTDKKRMNKETFESEYYSKVTIDL